MAEISTELRETERRVLGNLPAYRTSEGHEAAIADALEYGTIQDPAEWPKGRTVEDLTARLAKDRHCKVEADGEEFVRGVLDALEAEGLVKGMASGEYRMTEAGLSALTA